MTGNLKHTLSQGVWVLGDQRHMAELPARPRLLAVDVQVRAGDGRATADASGTAPIKLTIAACPEASVAAERQAAGSARRWFSNWLVSAPSIVQCPELCTRGAISLASSRPPVVEQLDREHADVVESLHAPPRACASAAVCSSPVAPAPARRERAGCRRGGGSRRAGSSANSPSRPRTAMIDSSRSNGTNASRIERHARRARARRRSSIVGARGCTACPLPS